ncbi:E3 ubiquitin-protein ligase TRIM39-like [Latimeria chalumnae]|uniref:E3 ubiquitin-protein ligase TRIM39-like n=1 Tax=Latimeria chalumnae TaxID=7897 RepID=UPI00313EAA03
MDSKRSAGSMEDEITCSVCQELFKDPVTLSCGHNFCRECVCEYWKEKTSQSCPICRADSAISDLITNHTLRNTIETYKKEGKKSKIQSESICSQHREELKLYCLEDQEAICLACQTSRKHENHKFLPIEEAAQEFKEELKISLKPLQDTHQKIAELKEKYRGNLNNIHDEVDKIEKQIKEDFVKLHQSLYEEEKNLLADLKKEEEEKEQKMRAMEESIVQDLTSVSKIIKDIQQKMDEEDQIFLMTLRDMRERIKEYADYKPREPEAVSAADIDGYKYTDRLQYRVWKKMLKIINPVTLDPNTAHPDLTLLEDLTIVTLGSTWRTDLPDNPERFDEWPCVLGSEGFTSGRHSWVVDVEKQTGWILGVAAESANRKGFIYLKPERGYWTVGLEQGVYSAFTDVERTQLKVLKTLKKVLVCVDYEAGKVSFSNADDRSHIYTFTHKFKHKIFPYFYIWSGGALLRICNL